MIESFRDYLEGVDDIESDAEYDRIMEEADRLIKNPAFRLILAKIEANAAAKVLSKVNEDTDRHRAIFQVVQDIRVRLKEMIGRPDSGER